MIESNMPSVVDLQTRLRELEEASHRNPVTMEMYISARRSWFLENGEALLAAYKALLIASEAQQKKIDSLETGLRKALACGLPPHDVSGMTMWRDAAAALNYKLTGD